MKFSEKVSEVRGRLLISQEQLAGELGVSFATINRWEQGRNAPSFLTQWKFNDFCKKHDIRFDDDEER
ncbi:MAG: helix-turn-helix domain-containing protein [Firmicutes bacterium]|nr:helix-turn-helix domain-containing protein [Bacillota bacterium]